VTDIADAHVHALHYLLVGGGSVALNLANSRNYSVLEVVNMAENVCGRPVKVDIAPRRAGDPSVPIGDAKRAKSSLNWTPTRSALETQILDAWNWVNGSGHSSTAFVDSLLFSTIYLPRGSVYIFAPSRMDRVDCG
jgi:UDP-glucose 4-epimerase